MNLAIFPLAVFFYILAASILFLILFSVTEKKEISFLISVLWLPIVVAIIIATISLFIVVIIVSPIQSIRGKYNEEFDLEINNHAKTA
jgi:hypothetical protein